MSEIRRKNDKNAYSVRDRFCIGCECLALGLYQHRGATLSGSRNTGSYSACCMTRAYHGCPLKTEFDKALAAKRKREEGMRVI